jgi:hypothetical protein
MIRCRTVLVVAVLAVVGSGCGVGVDAAPRPLEPFATVPLQPAPSVVARPDDPAAPCLPLSTRPAPTPAASTPTAPPSTAPPSTPSPATPPPAMTEPC